MSFRIDKESNSCHRNKHIPNGTNYSDYLFWNNQNCSWDVGNDYVHIGKNAGAMSTAPRSVAIGVDAGNQSQEPNAIAIGFNAGNQLQQQNAIAIGISAGNQSQGQGAIAIGVNSGANVQQPNAIAIGSGAGNPSQGAGAIAIGAGAGGTSSQGSSSIAVGLGAGSNLQGENSIAIGRLSGFLSCASNSIIIGADTTPLNSSTSGLFVSPITTTDNISEPNQLLQYNTETKEISSIARTSKTFIIDHPINKNKYLVHGCLEGPEVGVYYRGCGEILENKTEIKLPDYVNSFSTDFTVQITQIFDDENTKPVKLMSSKVTNGVFTVVGKKCKFFWHVHARRQDIEVEPYKTDVVVKGDGPYKYIE